MSKNKKIKVTKKDLIEAERKKLIEEEEEKQREKEKKKEEEKEAFKQRRAEWKKQELKKKLESIELKKKNARKKELLERKRKMQKIRDEKEMEEFKKEAFLESKPDEAELISISAERIKFREKKIKNNIRVLKIINKIERILFDVDHQYVYMLIMSKTVKYIVNNIKEEIVDVGPLDFLHDYIYSLPEKNPREKRDYIETLANYLLENANDIVSKLDCQFNEFI